MKPNYALRSLTARAVEGLASGQHAERSAQSAVREQRKNLVAITLTGGAPALRLCSPASAGLRETKERCKTLMEAQLECESFGIELDTDVVATWLRPSPKKTLAQARHKCRGGTLFLSIWSSTTGSTCTNRNLWMKTGVLVA